MQATVYAPASVGNVGPGFDVLGLAVEGLGDRVTVEICDTADLAVTVSGRDAADVPCDPTANSASIAARAILARHATGRHARVSIVKGLPLAGGLGGSAASAVGGALAAALATGNEVDRREVFDAAILGERTVSGEALDNLAACLFGGLILVRDAASRDVVSLALAKPLWVVLVSPRHRLETRKARAILPTEIPQALWVAQMANTAALVHAFETGDVELLRRALDDRFAEVHRAPWVPHFAEVKAAALRAGALGCSISGAGPTVFALTTSEAAGAEVGAAMQQAFGSTAAEVHVGQVAKTGARRV